jgi:hypothetical protein
MIKYNIMIFCLSDTDTSELDILIDTYDIRILNVETTDNYDNYSYIITEDDILSFLSELPYDYFVKYVFDDTIYQINLLKDKINADIYRNIYFDKQPNYKIKKTKTEKEIYNICKYIEKNNNKY